MRNPFKDVAELCGALRAATTIAFPEALPRRIKILPWGLSASSSGPARVGQKTVVNLPDNQRRERAEWIVLDFNHCTVPGSPEFEKRRKAGLRPIVFGSGRIKVVPGDGVWLEDVQWSPYGIQNARHFEDLSPAFTLDADGEVVFVRSVSLPDPREHRRINFSG